VPGIAVEAFLIDADNTKKFWEHGLFPEDVVEVLLSRRWCGAFGRSAERATC
jgi:hypothetical protein